jgi:hypothetical protein
MSGYWPHTATINDPNRVFDGMLAGTKGYVMFQEGKYYIINAKCDPEEIEACECEPSGENDCECSGA